MIFLLWVCAQASDEPWFLHYPLTVTPDGVGGVLHVRVTHARGDYGVWLYDPDGVQRRSQSVTPAVGVFFTYPANQAGTWTVTVGSPFATGVSANVDFTLAPSTSHTVDFGGGSCGLLGFEALFVLLAFRGWRRRTRQTASL
jgi:hypothetical protein